MSATSGARTAFGIELLQAIAIVLVLFAHGLMLALGDYPQLLPLFTVTAVFGIEMLLLLTGYFAAQSVIALLQTRLSLPQFWRANWLPIWPGYYLFLALHTLLYVYVFLLPAGGWSYLWFGQSLLTPAPSEFFGEGWRLAVEQWFFLLMPLLLLPLARFWPDRTRAIRLACLLLILLLPLLRVLYIEAMHPLWDSGLRKITLLRPDVLAWGLLFGYWQWRNADVLATRSRRLALVAVILLLPCTCYACALSLRGDVPLHGIADAILVAGFFSLLPAGLVCLLPVLEAWRDCGHARLDLVVRQLSRWSYSLYLVHLPLLYLLMYFAAARLKGRPLWMLSAAGAWLVVSLALAPIVQRVIERQFQRFVPVTLPARGD